MKYNDIQKIISKLSFENDLYDHPAMLEAEKVESEQAVNIVADALSICDMAIKKAATELFNLAGQDITTQDLEALAVLAEEFDKSDDPLLQKQASVLDFVLANFAQNGPLAVAKLSSAQEEDRLRLKYRQEAHENAYVKPREKYYEDMKAAEAVKAIKRDVKRFRPLESPLSTRHCPDHPGVSIMRVGENTYQCPLDKKIYPFEAGYTTMKGNVVPGSSVQNQTRDLVDREIEHAAFSTRETTLNM